MNTIDLITLREVYKLSNEELIEAFEKNLLPFKEDFNEKKKYLYDILSKKNIGIITYFDDEYPELLKEIPDPPVILYYIGDISLLKTNTVSVVGTRKPTEYGKKMCSLITNEINNYTIVSGMAFGIDSIAHMNSKKTIAVLGCGVDIIYPKANMHLYNKISNQGLIISEYFPGTKPAKYTFPYRNRIIAGLSKSTIVIEAAKKSGSLITANYAMDFGREVYALPGDINRINSYGTNYLIYMGAKPIYSLEEIQKTFNIEQLVKINNFSVEECSIINLINDGKNTVELLYENSNFEISKILSILMKLEISGHLQNVDGVYSMGGKV
ncbi:DNA polymerase III [Tepiditoga spiralis]|uniref:DNA polymerase III n=1 Tax=Tepiditoga spiralis TaxID=2108365 RepID=A0A7G1G1A1_9BACT|nr:DNA-processing protein DprA [Tepiditoga spiralis]BBE30031.1 DNA polymerase III [Tepiditoga spiralis]